MAGIRILGKSSNGTINVVSTEGSTFGIPSKVDGNIDAYLPCCCKTSGDCCNFEVLKYVDEIVIGIYVSSIGGLVGSSGKAKEYWISKGQTEYDRFGNPYQYFTLKKISNTKLEYEWIDPSNSATSIVARPRSITPKNGYGYTYYGIEVIFTDGDNDNIYNGVSDPLHENIDAPYPASKDYCYVFGGSSSLGGAFRGFSAESGTFPFFISFSPNNVSPAVTAYGISIGDKFSLSIDGIRGAGYYVHSSPDNLDDFRFAPPADIAFNRTYCLECTDIVNNYIILRNNGSRGHDSARAREPDDTITVTLWQDSFYRWHNDDTLPGEFSPRLPSVHIKILFLRLIARKAALCYTELSPFEELSIDFNDITDISQFYGAYGYGDDKIFHRFPGYISAKDPLNLDKQLIDISNISISLKRASEECTALPINNIKDYWAFVPPGQFIENSTVPKSVSLEFDYLDQENNEIGLGSGTLKSYIKGKKFILPLFADGASYFYGREILNADTETGYIQFYVTPTREIDYSKLYVGDLSSLSSLLYRLDLYMTFQTNFTSSGWGGFLEFYTYVIGNEGMQSNVISDTLVEFPPDFIWDKNKFKILGIGRGGSSLFTPRDIEITATISFNY